VDEVWCPAERWSAEERLQWQERRLRATLVSASRHADALRGLLHDVGVSPQEMTLADLRRLPVLSKDALPGAQRAAPLFAGWLGVPPDEIARVYRSPGPIYDPEGRDDDYWRFAPALFAAGLRPGDVVLNTLSYHLTPAGHMFDGALRALRCPVVPAGPGNTETQVRLLTDLGAAGFIGTPSFLATVLEAAAQARASLRLRVAFVIAEMLSESLRQDLEARHGVRVSQGYGTADLGSIAYECLARTGMHTAHELIVEVCEPGTGTPVRCGQPGEVVVTALNPVYPLLRFGTGDLAVMADGPCPCGRTAPRLARILGRIGDAVKVRGMFIHPADVDRVLTRCPEVARYQIVVTRVGHTDEALLRAEVVPGAMPSTELAERLRQHVVEDLRLRVAVEVVATGTLPGDTKKIVDQRIWD
jgi:phenylacetate-CoA ligase